MSQPGSLYEIRWNEIFPWLILVRSLRCSLLLRVLAIAFVGVLLTEWGWVIVDRIVAGHPARLERVTSPLAEPELISPTVGTASIQQASKLWKLTRDTDLGPLVRGWSWLSSSWVELANRETSWQRCWALLLSGLWAIAVWSLFGGAITRIAAVQLTRGEILGPLTALKKAAAQWGSTAGAPLIALLGGVALCVPLILDGVLLRIDFIALIAGLLWVLTIIWGFLLAVVFIGLLLGWPLMWATVAVERTDAFDGVSRCYAYVYQRPLHLAFYLLIATGLGLLGQLVVYYFSTAAVSLAEWTVSWGAGNERTAQLVDIPLADSDTAGMIFTASRLVHFWNWFLFAMVASYPVAYLWSAAVGIYLLLRRHIDSTELDEVSLDEAQTQQGLPNLPNDEAEPRAERKSTGADGEEEDSG